MNTITIPSSQSPTSNPKGFYLLEYFYVLLKSVEKYSANDRVFSEFKVLKKQYRLGESKYKVKVDIDEPSKTQEDRYQYTFRQVIEESVDYDLIEKRQDDLILTPKGAELLNKYENQDIRGFNVTLFQYMEARQPRFRDLITRLYGINQSKPGLMIFPIYSPRLLGFERNNVRTTGDIATYSYELVKKLEWGIKTFLGDNRTLSGKNEQLLRKLKEDNIIPDNPLNGFVAEKYNVIIKRVRDFWISYFLKDVYKLDMSLTAFERWIYRGKQIGIIYATEFYPNFNGRIVYPTSVVIKQTSSKDYSQLFQYEDGFGLFIHEPVWNEETQQQFVRELFAAYYDIHHTNRSYFVNLLAVREKVCYALKISEYLFAKFLGDAYKLNLAGKLTIRFSLEVDKLPEETNAMYLKQEPVMVDGKYRNIIAVDVTRGELSRE